MLNQTIDLDRTFQALADITHQRLPSDSAAWRNWYASTRNDQ